MRQRPALIPKGPGAFLIVLLAAAGAIARRDYWIAAIVGAVVGLRLVLWAMAPYVRWAKEAIDPGPETLKRMNRQADTLEKSRIPDLGWASRQANRGQWWRDPPDDSA